MSRREEKYKMDEIVAFLGKGTEFKGVITYNGTIRIDGKVEGEIVSQGALIIGESAVINAEISVESIICSGKINGDVHAGKKVHLLQKAAFEGSIKTPSLIIDEGVQFNGSCDMNQAQQTQKEETVTRLQAVGQETEG